MLTTWLWSTRIEERWCRRSRRDSAKLYALDCLFVANGIKVELFVAFTIIRSIIERKKPSLHLQRVRGGVSSKDTIFEIQLALRWCVCVCVHGLVQEDANTHAPQRVNPRPTVAQSGTAQHVMCGHQRAWARVSLSRSPPASHMHHCIERSGRVCSGSHFGSSIRGTQLLDSNMKKETWGVVGVSSGFMALAGDPDYCQTSQTVEGTWTHGRVKSLRPCWINMALTWFSTDSHLNPQATWWPIMQRTGSLFYTNQWFHMLDRNLILFHLAALVQNWKPIDWLGLDGTKLIELTSLTLHTLSCGHHCELSDTCWQKVQRMSAIINLFICNLQRRSLTIKA